MNKVDAFALVVLMHRDELRPGTEMVEQATAVARVLAATHLNLGQYLCGGG